MEAKGVGTLTFCMNHPHRFRRALVWATLVVLAIAIAVIAVMLGRQVWAAAVAFALAIIPALWRTVAISWRRTLQHRRWSIADYAAEFLASWCIVIFISAAAVTAFALVYHLAWRLTFQIPAQSLLVLSGFLLGVYAGGCVASLVASVLWSDGRGSARPVATSDALASAAPPPTQPFQFSMGMMLAAVAVVGVAVKLSMVSWAGLALLAIVLAAFIRTRFIARRFPAFQGRPPSWGELARAFFMSAVIASGILIVGLGIFEFTRFTVLLLFRQFDLYRASDLAVAWAIHLTPPLLAMVLVAKDLWPIERYLRRLKRKASVEP